MGMGITLTLTNLLQKLRIDWKRDRKAETSDISSKKRLKTGTFASHPHQPLICVCNRAEDSISVMAVSSTGEMQETSRLDAGSNPTVAGWSQDGRRLFVLNAGLGISVWRQCPNRGLRKVGFFLVGADCSDFVISRDERFVYVAQASEGQIAVFEMEGGRLTTRGSVPCWGEPEALEIHGNLLRVSSPSSRQVTCFEIGTGGELQNPSVLSQVAG